MFKIEKESLSNVSLTNYTVGNLIFHYIVGPLCLCGQRRSKTLFVCSYNPENEAPVVIVVGWLGV